MRVFSQCVIVAVLVAWGTPVFAQSNTSTVTGTIKDEQALALPGATVELLNEETGASRRATSGGNGSFTITAVPQGRYTLKVTLEGFKTVERRAIQLTANETFNAGTVALAVGQFSEVTTVTAELGNVQTGSSGISTVLEAQAIDSLMF